MLCGRLRANDFVLWRSPESRLGVQGAHRSRGCRSQPVETGLPIWQRLQHVYCRLTCLYVDVALRRGAGVWEKFPVGSGVELGVGVASHSIRLHGGGDARWTTSAESETGLCIPLVLFFSRDSLPVLPMPKA